MALDPFGNSSEGVGLEVEVLTLSVLSAGDRTARRRYPRCCDFDRCAAGGHPLAGVAEQSLDDVRWERLIKATPANL
ncbi:MAG: hypothetical protein QOJ66_2405 [Ilumatobacteraceae bacterium]|jgi:hypothetical protein